MTPTGRPAVKRVAHSGAVALSLAAAAMLAVPAEAPAYIEAAYGMGQLINESTNILLVQVEKLDREKNLIIYRRIRDIKGTNPGDTIKHNIGQRGFHPREWQNIMAWAEVGKVALFFHNNGAGEMCLDNYWYQVYAGDWWAMSHAEPFLLRTYAGKPERLATLVATMLTGQEVIVPCLADGDKNALHLRQGRVQRLKVSLKAPDYNPKRDFVGWGVEEFRAIGDMPGFTHYAPICRLGRDAGGIAPADLDGDGKTDLCLYGASKVVLLQNAAGSFNEVSLPVQGGARAAAWADYDGDGKLDLLLATPQGPRLFQNDGKGGFRDVTAALPPQGYYHTTAAAWLDYDGDKRPDILLADGFRGLRLYRNRGGGPAPSPATVRSGAWYYAGPFPNPGGAGGFGRAYGPERDGQIDLAKEYPLRDNRKITWREGNFQDGQINSLALFKPEENENSVVYLYRELDFGRAVELPVSLGSDDTLTVWLNGQKVHSENVSRSCAPDQVMLMLKLRPGKNALLMKICNGTGEFAFYFAAKREVPVVPRLFQDVSDAAGLGEGGLAGGLKGDHLAVADVNGDGRQDFLFSAGSGILALANGKGFAAATGSGLAYQTGRVAPAFGDFDGDGKVDLAIPQRSGCRLFRNLGDAKFADVTAQSGALAAAMPQPTSAAWADLGKQGRGGLLIGCLAGPNRYFRHLGGGKFEDAGEELGLYRRIFNTSGVAVVDVNIDGMPDVVLSNEGQESAVLLGKATQPPAVAAR